MSRPACRLPALLLTAVVFSTASTAVAQVITDPTAPIQFQPSITSAPNGTPVINITPPSAGGLSHNKFQRYDVDTQGLILNNSMLPGTSVLGGTVGANPNIAGKRSADVILNEVTGSTASVLNGPTEVFGPRADVIIANPNGIGCVGCTFINSGRVTLSTGVPDPDYARGTVHHQVTRGTVSISGDGVSAPAGAPLQALDLIGRQIDVKAPIVSTGDVRLRAGSIAFDQRTGQTAPIMGAPAITGPAITQDAGGVIYGGSISVLSHDTSIGVSLQGDLVTLSGDLEILSEGDLAAARSFSSRDTRINARGRITLTGLHEALGRIEVQGDNVDIALDTTVAANQSIVVAALDDLVSNGTLQSGQTVTLSAGDRIVARGLILATGAVWLSGSSLETDGLEAAADEFTLAASGDVSLDETFLLANTRIGISGRDVRLGAQTGFDVLGLLSLHATRDLINETVLTASDLTLSVGRDVINAETGAIVDDVLDWSVGNRIINSGLIFGQTSAELSFGALENTATGIIAAPDLVLQGDSVSNLGQILADNTLAITSATFLNAGEIQSLGTLSVTAGSLSNQASGTISAFDLSLIAAGTINNAGDLLAASLLTLSGDALVNGDDALIAATVTDITTRGGIVNRGGIEGVSALLVSSGGRLDNTGRMMAGDAVLIEAATGADNQGVIASGGVLELIASNGSIVNGRFSASNPGGGIIYAAGDMILSAFANVENNASFIEAGGMLAIGAGGDVLNRRAAVRETVDEDRSDYPLMYITYNQYETSLASVISAGGDLLIEADRLVNTASTISSGGDATFLVRDYQNNARTLRRETEWWRHDCVGAGCQSRTWRYHGSIFNNVETPALVYAAGELIVSATGSYHNTGTELARQIAVLAPTITVGITDPNVITAIPSFPDSAIDLTTAPGAGSIARPNEITGSGIEFLYSSPLSGIAAGRSADWILEQVGDARANFVFYADADLERRLLQEALVVNTANLFLDPSYTSMEEQRRALQQATVDFLLENPGIQLGDQLTGEQIARLTKPMIWYESRRIDDRDVLVPILILPDSIKADLVKLTGGSVQARDVFLSGDAVTNTGSLLAEARLTIVADTFLNEQRTAIRRQGVRVRNVFGSSTHQVTYRDLQFGGVMAADEILVETTGSITNRGGDILARSYLQMVSTGGDIVNEVQEYQSVVSWNRGWLGALLNYKSYDIATHFEPGQVFSGGHAVFSAANGRILNHGSEITAVGDLYLTARTLIEQDAEMASHLAEQRAGCSGFSCRGVTRYETVVAEAAMRSLAGSVIAEVTDGDFVSRGSGVEALNGLVAITARDIVFEARAKEVRNRSWGLEVSPTGFSYDHETASGWTTALPWLAAYDIQLDASRDVRGTGVLVQAVNDLMITAGRDIVFDAHQNLHVTKQWGVSVRVSYPGSALLEAAVKGDAKGMLGALLSSSPIGSALFNLYEGHPRTAAWQFGTAGWKAMHGLAKNSQTAGQTADALSAANANTLNDLWNPFSAANNPFAMANWNFGVTVSAYKQKTEWTESFVTHLIAGGDTTLIAGGQLSLLGGTQLRSGGDAHLEAANIRIEALKDTYYSSGRSGSLGVSVSMSGSIGVNVSASHNKSYGITYTNALVEALGRLTILTPGDLTVRGGTLSGGSVVMDIGGNFHLESMQDVAYSKSSSFSAGLSIGLPTGFMPQPPLDLAAAASGQIAPKSTTILPASFGLGRDKSHSVWTNQISEVRSGGLLDITVGGHTSLVGSTLWSATDELSLKTASLSVEDLHDFDKGNGFNFSVGGLDGLISPKAGSDGYTSPFAGMLSASAHERDKRGITYSVIGNGTIEIGGDTGHPIIATLKRDLTDRQIVTVDDKRGFSFDVPLVNFNVLAGQAKDIGNFLKSVTAPLPPSASARGTNGEMLYRRMLAFGISEQEAAALFDDPDMQQIVDYYDQRDRLIASGEEVPPGLLAALALGEVKIIGDALGDPNIVINVNCNASDPRCKIAYDEYKKLFESKEYLGSALEELAERATKVDGIDVAKLDQLYDILVYCIDTDPEIFYEFVNNNPELVAAMSLRNGLDYERLLLLADLRSFDWSAVADEDRYETELYFFNRAKKLVTTPNIFFHIDGSLTTDERDRIISDMGFYYLIPLVDEYIRDPGLREDMDGLIWRSVQVHPSLSAFAGGASFAMSVTQYASMARMATLARLRGARGTLPGESVPNLTPQGTLVNLRPNDPAIAQRPIRTLVQDETGRYWLQTPGGRRLTPSGSYDFVTMPDGTIKISRPNVNQEFSTHLGLSSGGEVRFAGSIRFGNNSGPNRGQITFWNNASGHYQPPASLNSNAGLPLNLFNPY